jgi:hypothetical protein
MYEDKRIIEPTGMLSQASKPTYQPKPITMKFNNASKPAADHVNPNKDKEWQRKYQEESMALQKKQFQLQYMQAAASAGAGGGGMSVICTRYHELGFLPDELYAADEAFGRRLLLESPDLMFWYWSWAPRWVERCMHGKTFRSQLLIVMFWPLCRAWATEMAHRQGVVKRGSWLGKAAMKMALWACKTYAFNSAAHV